MNMTFQLKDFDGPLDLLLTLVGKAEIDIKDIFVSRITDQYIQLVRTAPDLDMEEATDFLVMAATLLEIKSRSMLPKPPKIEEGEQDPQAVLLRQLQEYKRFKETTRSMQQFEQAAKYLFAKLPQEYPLPPQQTELVGLTLQGLTDAFLRIWARKPESAQLENNHYAPRDIHRDEHNVQQCMLDIMHRIKRRGSMRFDEAFSSAPTKEQVVTFFLAMLELLKLGHMHAVQENIWGEIILYAGKAQEPERSEQEVQ